MAALLYDSFLVFAIWMLIGYLIQLFPGVNARILMVVSYKSICGLPSIFANVFSACLLLLVLAKKRANSWYVSLRLRLKSESDYLTVRQVFRWLMAWPSFLLLESAIFGTILIKW